MDSHLVFQNKWTVCDGAKQLYVKETTRRTVCGPT